MLFVKLMEICCVLDVVGKCLLYKKENMRSVSQWPDCLPLPPPQPFLLHGCLQFGQVRKAQQRWTTTVPQTRRKTTASTTPPWTGGSSCATPGIWNQLSGQRCSTAPGFSVPCFWTFSYDESDWVFVPKAILILIVTGERHRSTFITPAKHFPENYQKHEFIVDRIPSIHWPSFSCFCSEKVPFIVPDTGGV